MIRERSGTLLFLGIIGFISSAMSFYFYFESMSAWVIIRVAITAILFLISVVFIYIGLSGYVITVEDFFSEVLLEDILSENRKVFIKYIVEVTV